MTSLKCCRLCQIIRCCHSSWHQWIWWCWSCHWLEHQPGSPDCSWPSSGAWSSICRRCYVRKWSKHVLLPEYIQFEDRHSKCTFISLGHWTERPSECSPDAHFRFLYCHTWKSWRSSSGDCHPQLRLPVWLQRYCSSGGGSSQRQHRNLRCCLGWWPQHGYGQCHRKQFNCNSRPHRYANQWHCNGSRKLIDLPLSINGRHSHKWL